MLEAFNICPRVMNIRLHLSEVKGPVMDRLEGTHFIKTMTGRIFLSQYDAFKALSNADSKAREY